MITHASTFSGIGAPEVAAEMLGWENVFHCEINPFGRKVLDYYFPKAKSYEDITRTDFSEWRDQVTVLTGGFPCQPFSYAGKRRGSEDDRYLWPFMLRCIEQVRPSWFVGENVAGITTMAFPGEDVKVGEQTDLFGACDEVYEKHERYVLDEICESLERAGYSVQPMLIPACAVGAPHRRDRVFIVAHRREAVQSTDTSSERHTPLSDGGRMDRREGQTMDEERKDESFYGTRRPCSERSTPDPSCSGSGAQAESERLISEWRDRLSLASQRGDSPQRTDGLSALQGHISYTPSQRRREIYEQVQSKLADGEEPFGNGRERNVTDTCGERLEGMHESRSSEGGQRMQVRRNFAGHDCESVERMLPENRWRTFPSVSPVYRGNDGLPFPVDHLTIPFSEWKRESLKAYGNAIVPQVMYERFRCIDEIEKTLNPE